MKRRNFVGLLAVPAALAAKNIVQIDAQKSPITDEQKRDVILRYVLASIGYKETDGFHLRLEDHTFGDGTTCVVAQPYEVREFYAPALFAKTGADSVQCAYEAIMARSEDVIHQPNLVFLT